MSNKYENSNSQTKPSDVECEACNDTGGIIDKVYDEDYGREVDIYRPCHCQKTKSLKNRFKNALIPDEFKEARFDNYEQNSEAQKTLYKAIQEYLKGFPSIIKDKPEHNSLGFIAVFGESRIRLLSGEAKYKAKSEHNNFGLGKTHLQMAAAKWILNRIRVRDEIAPGQFSRFDRGARVLCVSDITFMDDLTNARMAGDGGETLRNLLDSAINADVLVWDDLGKAKWSESKEGLYYQIINERYLHKRPILFSSNEDAGTLSDKIGYAASSRLLGMCGDRLYRVEGEDYRLRKGSH
ncbi:ATP-binding protein [Oceanobacillus luteolus]|uniref:ATP-binding protein n=1 Tax=Oceanobacillus luteolus TaxID=1274358 RepID=UPI00203F67B8|nr:ATP-binding protein [Oceanobacillus luteolus]MCM3739202.1 ATP-binding protein [Oceanobacillus luteolus]